MIGRAFAQSSIDSIDLSIENEKNDSVKFALMIKAGKANVMGNKEKAEMYANKALAFAKQKGTLLNQSQAHRLLGTINYYRDDYYKGIEEYNKAIELSKLAKDDRTTSSQYRNVALCYTKLGKISKAADYYFKSLKIAERFSDSSVVGNVYNDLGNLFYRQKKTEKAQSYYIQSYNIYKGLKDEAGMAVELNNIGSTYSETKDYTFALIYYTKSFDLRKKVADTIGLITSYTNIAQIYSLRHEHDKALKNNLEALNLALTIKYDYAISNVYSSLAEAYKEKKDYSKASEYANKCLEMQEKMHDLEKRLEVHKQLFEIYDLADKPAQALIHYRKYLIYRDSMINQESGKIALQLQMQYDFDKKQLADSIRTAEKSKIDEVKHQQEISDQKTYMYGGVIGFALMIIVSAVSFKAYRQKRKDNLVITEQKLHVEEKQKEILDSIHYARRIQQSLLPSEKYIEKNLSRLNTGA